METLKVSSTSDPSSTAGALANSIRENGKVELQVIGPKAVNQAIKAIAIARGYIAPSGVDLVSVPQFVDITIDGEERTAIRMLVEPRNPLSSLKSRDLTSQEEQEVEEKPETLETEKAEMEVETNEMEKEEESQGGEESLDIF
jgi:stage V sporulation protein S